MHFSPVSDMITPDNLQKGGCMQFLTGLAMLLAGRGLGAHETSADFRPAFSNTYPIADFKPLYWQENYAGCWNVSHPLPVLDFTSVKRNAKDPHTNTKTLQALGTVCALAFGPLYLMRCKANYEKQLAESLMPHPVSKVSPLSSSVNPHAKLFEPTIPLLEKYFSERVELRRDSVHSDDLIDAGDQRLDASDDDLIDAGDQLLYASDDEWDLEIYDARTPPPPLKLTSAPAKTYLTQVHTLLFAPETNLAMA